MCSQGIGFFGFCGFFRFLLGLLFIVGAIFLVPVGPTCWRLLELSPYIGHSFLSRCFSFLALRSSREQFLHLTLPGRTILSIGQRWWYQPWQDTKPVTSGAASRTQLRYCSATCALTIRLKDVIGDAQYFLSLRKRSSHHPCLGHTGAKACDTSLCGSQCENMRVMPRYRMGAAGTPTGYTLLRQHLLSSKGRHQDFKVPGPSSGGRGDAWPRGAW